MINKFEDYEKLNEASLMGNPGLPGEPGEGGGGHKALPPPPCGVGAPPRGGL